MAKLVTQTFIVTVSRMVRDTDHAAPVVTEDFAQNLEAVVTELAAGTLVEVMGVDND